MDEDTIFLIFVILFLGTILSLPLTITACIALSNTRAWAKDKRRRQTAQYGMLPQKEGAGTADPEADAANASSSDDEESDCGSEHASDYIDSEDERYATSRRAAKQARREEKQADMEMSAQAKFLKEWKKCWKGNGLEKVRAEEERKREKERRTMAREVVREYLRVQRKKERKAKRAEMEGMGEGMELPSYGKAVEEKH